MSGTGSGKRKRERGNITVVTMIFKIFNSSRTWIGKERKLGFVDWVKTWPELLWSRCMVWVTQEPLPSHLWIGDLNGFLQFNVACIWGSAAMLPSKTGFLSGHVALSFIILAFLPRKEVGSLKICKATILYPPVFGGLSVLPHLRFCF